MNRLSLEFNTKHLSGNLLNTINIIYNDDNLQIEIPAQVYDILLYKTKGVVIPVGNKSYASKLNDEGSNFYIGKYHIRPGNHKYYIDRIIDESIEEWLSQFDASDWSITES